MLMVGRMKFMQAVSKHLKGIFELVKKSSLVNSIKFANYIASLKCKKFGGSSGSPFIYEINENFDL